MTDCDEIIRVAKLPEGENLYYEFKSSKILQNSEVTCVGSPRRRA